MDLGANGRTEVPIAISTGTFAPVHAESGTPKPSLVTGVANGGSTGLSEEEIPLISEAKVKKPVKYRECQKNHAANLGGYAIDGCGEFMPCGEEGTLEALRCAACDCHRNFHRREVEGEPACDCCFGQQCRRDGKRLLPSILPPHTSSGFSPNTALHRPTQMIMAMNTHTFESDEQDGGEGILSSMMMAKKRFRTKFTFEQKEKMLAFAEKVGWRLQKHDHATVQQLCSDLGISRQILKVWMHNNKNTLGKKL